MFINATEQLAVGKTCLLIVPIVVFYTRDQYVLTIFDTMPAASGDGIMFLNHTLTPGDMM